MSHHLGSDVGSCQHMAGMPFVLALEEITTVTFCTLLY